MTLNITLIAGLAHNRVIGINNTLPWKLSADLKRFKSLTTGHPLLMGRKTFESLGRPLPLRRHICVSRNFSTNKLTPDERWPDQVFWCGDLFAAVKLISEQNLLPEDQTLYIIGGAEIYAQSLGIADTLELTHIDHDFVGDAFFPFYENLFAQQNKTSGEETGIHYTFAQYKSLRPADFFVRPAGPSDALFIAQAQVKMARESENLQLNEDIVRRGVEEVFKNHTLGEYLIAEHGSLSSSSHPVGCLLLQREWSDWRNGCVEWMHSVYVTPAERQKGVFRWMHQVAIARARTRGSLGLRLYVDKKNTRAQRAYTSLGMTNHHYDLFEILFH